MKILTVVSLYTFALAAALAKEYVAFSVFMIGAFVIMAMGDQK